MHDYALGVDRLKGRRAAACLPPLPCHVDSDFLLSSSGEDTEELVQDGGQEGNHHVAFHGVQALQTWNGKVCIIFLKANQPQATSTQFQIRREEVHLKQWKAVARRVRDKDVHSLISRACEYGTWQKGTEAAHRLAIRQGHSPGLPSVTTKVLQEEWPEMQHCWLWQGGRGRKQRNEGRLPRGGWKRTRKQIQP